MTAAPSATQPDRRTLMVGKGWIQAVALVVIFGFFVMGILAYRTYTAPMPQL
jgi:nitric oxide reductase subunit B